MEKTIEYEIYENGEPKKVTESVMVSEAAYIDTVRAKQQAQTFSRDNDVELVPELIHVIGWIKKSNGERYTYAELMESRAERINALYAKALSAFMGITEAKKKPSKPKPKAKAKPKPK